MTSESTCGWLLCRNDGPDHLLDPLLDVRAAIRDVPGTRDAAERSGVGERGRSPQLRSNAPRLNPWAVSLARVWSSYEASFLGGDHGLGAGLHPELLEQVVDVPLHGPRAQIEVGGDLLVGGAGG